VIALPTPDGGVLRLTYAGAGECDACGTTTRSAKAEISTDRAGVLGRVCGGCVAAGLAAVLGAGHLAAGGRLGDLTLPPADDAGVCPSCGRGDGVERDSGDPDARTCAHDGATWRGRRDNATSLRPLDPP
jgi:hypothetical protein